MLEARAAQDMRVRIGRSAKEGSPHGVTRSTVSGMTSMYGNKASLEEVSGVRPNSGNTITYQKLLIKCHYQSAKNSF